MLNTLDVSKNELGVGGTTEIAGALSSGGAPQLQSLSIGYNDVGDEGAAVLGKAVGLRLASLDLSGNALSGVGVGAVLAAPGLREAKLFHNTCGDEGKGTHTKLWNKGRGGRSGNTCRVLPRMMLGCLFPVLGANDVMYRFVCYAPPILASFPTVRTPV